MLWHVLVGALSKAKRPMLHSQRRNLSTIEKYIYKRKKQESYLSESPQPKATVLRDSGRVVGPRSKADNTKTAKGLQAVRCWLIGSTIAQPQLAICVRAPHQHCAGWGKGHAGEHRHQPRDVKR